MFLTLLPLRYIESMSYKLEITEFIKGDHLCRQGEEADFFYIISEGEVEVSALNRDGDKVHLADLGSGQVIGEIALFAGGKRTADVVAKTDVKAFRVNKGGYEELMKDLPDWTVSLIESLIERLRRADHRILENSIKEKKIKALLENQ